jgi:hypothetical protein
MVGRCELGPQVDGALVQHHGRRSPQFGLCNVAEGGRFVQREKVQFPAPLTFPM